MSGGEPTAPRMDAPRDTRKDLIAATLAGKFRWLRFPDALEREFLGKYADYSVIVVRRVLPWITLLYAASAAVMYGAASPATFAAWTANAMWPVATVLVALSLSALGGLLARAVHLQVGLAMTVALFCTVRTVFVLGDDPATVYVTYQVIYLLFIAYTISRLRFLPAIGWVTLAGVLAIASALVENLPANWLSFAQYYAATALISAVIGYVMEYRDRADWLKTRQHDIQVGELNRMRARAEAEHRRQRLLGDYLARIGGNLTSTEIAGRTLAFLVEHSGAQIGAIFLLQGARLRRAAAIGLDGETRLPDDLGRGETLIGQVAQDRRRLRLTHLPADYNTIRTATGEAPPAELLVEPVCRDQDSLAVIELGALAPFDDTVIGIVEHVAQAMAGALVAAHAREALARAGMDEFVI